LERTDWLANDTVAESPYPRRTAKQQTYLFHKAFQSTLLNTRVQDLLDKAQVNHTRSNVGCSSRTRSTKDGNMMFHANHDTEDYESNLHGSGNSRKAPPVAGRQKSKRPSRRSDLHGALSASPSSLPSKRNLSDEHAEETGSTRRSKRLKISIGEPGPSTLKRHLEPRESGSSLQGAGRVAHPTTRREGLRPRPARASRG
jgi:hypothetical protein